MTACRHQQPYQRSMHHHHFHPMIPSDLMTAGSGSAYCMATDEDGEQHCVSTLHITEAALVPASTTDDDSPPQPHSPVASGGNLSPGTDQTGRSASFDVIADGADVANLARQVADLKGRLRREMALRVRIAEEKVEVETQRDELKMSLVSMESELLKAQNTVQVDTVATDRLEARVAELEGQLSERVRTMTASHKQELRMWSHHPAAAQAWRTSVHIADTLSPPPYYRSLAKHAHFHHTRAADHTSSHG